LSTTSFWKGENGYRSKRMKEKKFCAAGLPCKQLGGKDKLLGREPGCYLSPTVRSKSVSGKKTNEKQRGKRGGGGLFRQEKGEKN